MEWKEVVAKVVREGGREGGPSEGGVANLQ